MRSAERKEATGEVGDLTLFEQLLSLSYLNCRFNRLWVANVVLLNPCNPTPQQPDGILEQVPQCLYLEQKVFIRLTKLEVGIMDDSSTHCGEHKMFSHIFSPALWLHLVNTQEINRFFSLFPEISCGHPVILTVDF